MAYDKLLAVAALLILVVAVLTYLSGSASIAYREAELSDWLTRLQPRPRLLGKRKPLSWPSNMTL